ncbi:MAG: hypothetical protein RL398_921 [Planctomycetota bacterium]|jgi:hypothetical protein
MRAAFLLLTAGFLSTAVSVLSAQEPQGATGAAVRTRKVAQVGRVAPEQVPVVDGRLDDACWADAPSLGDLTMVEPWEGRAPSVRTEVRLLHDRDNLYLALWCYEDKDPVVATMRARDARLDPDDRVEIIFDPMESRQMAYFFQVGAAGSLGDGLISANGNKFDKPWDTIWSGEVTRTADGWFAELAIPFRSLPRREGAATWGFNLQRHARVRNEVYRWDNARQSISFFRPSELGTLAGFGAIEAGYGLEFVPYLTFKADRDLTAGDGDWGRDTDAGGEIYWRITPALKLALTANTDFAETEADGRQINLNRYPLFFPEKRDFFLDGAGYFQFGSSSAGGVTYLPFFSRRIGLSPSREPIPLLGGVKLTGRSGPVEIGILDVQTDASANTDEENLAVARVRYSLAEETAIGVLATHGDPRSTGTNSVGGLDFYHRWPDLFGDQDLQVQVDAAKSTGNVGGDEGDNFGIDVRSRGREWDFEVSTRWIEEEFRPALGFIGRTGTRAVSLDVDYSPRAVEGSAIRNGLFSIGAERYESLSGEPQDTKVGVDQLGAAWQTEDRAYLFAHERFERVENEFRLFRDSVAIAPGDYRTVRGGVAVTTSEGRPWNVDARVTSGEFFDGRSDDFSIDGEWRTSALLHLAADYQTTRVDLGPGRDFTTQIIALRAELHFAPTLSLYNLAQYDNESEQIGWQSRLRWIYQPGCDFFAVLGTTWRYDDGAVATEQQELAFKVQHTLRF